MKPVLHVLLLLFVVVIVRLPSFFFSVFDWDESTFTIVGQSILNGNMPYVDAWDIKPPLAYYAYALFIAVFGKSIISIRLGGMLCLYLSAILLYETGRAVRNKTTGIVAAIFLVVFASTGPSGLSTMTEHILLVPFTLVLYLFFATAFTRKTALIAGIVLGMAILIKTNMVFESLALLIVLSAGYLQVRLDFPERLKRCALLLAGLSLPVLVMVGYYFVNHNVDLLFRTNITAVSRYIETAASFQEKVTVLLHNMSENFRMNPLLWIVSLFGAISLIILKRTRTPFLSAAPVIFGLQIFSLFLAGQPFGYHYLITTMPVPCLVSGFAVSEWISVQASGRTIKVFAASLLIVAGFAHSLQDNVVRLYRELGTRFIQQQPLMDDSCYRIARFLEKNNAAGHYVYMVNACQISGWLAGSRYPTKYIHPSNMLLREYMLKIIDGPGATKEKELRAILEKHPLFIIHRTDLWPQQLADFRTILDRELQDNYALVATVDTTYVIFRRRDGMPAPEVRR
jgi:4-amino-4-deoxy-L-arabinose transferase-like glycosyltransferase